MLLSGNQQIGYDFDALPEDYIEQPPDDLSRIKHNLDLIKAILNPRDDKHGVKDIVTRLKVTIVERNWGKNRGPHCFFLFLCLLLFFIVSGKCIKE